MILLAFRDGDWPESLRLSLALFPDRSSDDLAAGMREFRHRADGEVFVAQRPNGLLGGFVEVGTRLYAGGCDTSPVGYIEAWYVDPDARRQDRGRALLMSNSGSARRLLASA